MKQLLPLILGLLFGSGVAHAAEPPILVKDGETIAFLGDSITAGGASYTGYCRLVLHGLKTKGIRAKGIFAGVPGNKSSDMLLRLESVLKHKPDHLFLSAGVNDIWHADPTVKIGVFQAKPGMGVKLEHYKIYMAAILDRCKAAGTKVILSTITPIKEDPEFKLNKTAQQYNAFLTAQARARNLPIARLHEAMFEKIAELRKGGATRNVVSGDGVHPNFLGYQVMAKGILKAMGLTEEDLSAAADEWNSSPRILILGDRQVNAGFRSGGWCHMLLDCLNSGREMITASTLTGKKETVLSLAGKLTRYDTERLRSVLLVPPMGDIQKETSPDQYKTALLSVVEWAAKAKLKLAITTLPIVGSESSSKENAAIQPYNQVIRDLSREKSVSLADLNAAMSKRLTEAPAAQLNLGAERLSHPGGVLMAEAVFVALGGDTTILPDLRVAWDKRGSFTYRYSDSVSFAIPFMKTDEKVLEEIRNRYHRLDDRKILGLGKHLLLEGDDKENQARLDFVGRNWFRLTPKAPVRHFKMTPGSASEKRAIQAYMAREKIDLPTFCQRAFKVGVYALRKEDILARGAY